MSIDVNDINKYRFNPRNPKQCRSYNLLLDIAKKESFVYVSSEFIAYDFGKIIINQEFNNKLWDKPKEFDSLYILDQINLFKKSLSDKEYYEHIESLKINSDEFIFNKLFKSFIDLHPSFYIIKLQKYDEKLLKNKLLFNNSLYSFAGYQQYKDNYTFIQSYHGHKIFFTNDAKDLENHNALFDISSIIVTTNEDIFINTEESMFLGERVPRHNINKNIKPIFLKKMDDLPLLLNILQEDLKREKSKEKIIENIYNIDTLKIENFFSIKNIELQNLQEKKEIYIVGENGDGKTLFLQALALGLKGVDEGDVFDLVKSQKDYILKIEDTNSNSYTSRDESYKNFFAYGANRNNNCQMREDETGYLTLFNSSFDLKNPMDWLKYLDYSEKSGKENVISVENAKNLLQELLESDVQINIEPDKVTFIERGSEVNFEQLSAGYKGVITIVTDLLVRLSENQSDAESVKDFKGIVLIDEVELHLHPKWKYNFVKKLRTIFPNIQFIMTTHSPTVILGASKEAVFYKIYKEDGEVKISNQIENEGYTNNTLVSSPLFELETVTSRDFDKNVSSDDYIYEKIHERISKKISLESLEDKEKIAKLIDNELAKL
jgi:predicted ATP-binding protein involved in virulence